MASVNENPESKMAEKEEESKLKAKYPQIQRPGPQFLQKRLQKGQKFFDSGDYNMAKAAAAKGGTTPKSRLSMNQSSTQATSAIPPTITTAPPTLINDNDDDDVNPLTMSIRQHEYQQQPQPTLPSTMINSPVTTGEVIPTPDCLATRKASIHVPSKLISGGP